MTMSSTSLRTDVPKRSHLSHSLANRQTGTQYLDAAVESVNKQIDGDIKTLLDTFEALIGLSRIRDKDKYRIAQENFELEARADVMVRAAQSLTLLSHSLKLSLVMSLEPTDSAKKGGGTLDEEAEQLIASTTREQERCAHILQEMFNIDVQGQKEESLDQGATAPVNSEVRTTESEQLAPETLATTDNTVTEGGTTQQAADEETLIGEASSQKEGDVEMEEV